MPPFKLDTVFTPTADQPHAIGKLALSFAGENNSSTLLGATGTGETMMMAGVIERSSAARW